MGDLVTTNDARRKLAKKFGVENFNKISVLDVKKFYTFINKEKDGTKYWFPIYGKH